MDEAKLLRVVGLASASLFDKENPFNPSNRRISLIVMNKQAEENALKDSGMGKLKLDELRGMSVNDAAPVDSAE
jgi:chemotaxis protein MotB